MESTKKGTRVYTRMQASTGREITVRKRKQAFVLYIDNQETEEFSNQRESMQAADRLAESSPER